MALVTRSPWNNPRAPAADKAGARSYSPAGRRVFPVDHTVAGIDNAGNLVEAGNKRAAEAGLSRLTFHEGDACSMERAGDDSFDPTLTVFGAMFAPKPFDLLTHDGDLTLVGAPDKPLSVSAFSLIFGRRSLSGSLIGGLAETQEMLDFCGAHNITADVEVIPVQKLNEAYDRLVRADVKYRFSIDMASLKSD